MKTFQLLLLLPCFTLLSWADTPSASIALAAAPSSASSAPAKEADPTAIDALLKALHFDENMMHALTIQKQTSLRDIKGILAQSTTKHLSQTDAAALVQKSVDESWAGITLDGIHAIGQRVYSQTFTTEEARAIADFLNSPAGHALMSEQPQAQRKVMSELTPSIVQAMQKVKRTISALGGPPAKPGSPRPTTGAPAAAAPAKPGAPTPTTPPKS